MASEQIIKMAQAPTKYQPLRVEEAEGQRTKLIVPHNGGELVFLYPPYGPGTYANIGLSIEQNGLKKPTMEETTSLACAAFNSSQEDRYGNEIKNLIIGRDWLCVFTGNLYVPNEGVFIQDDPEIRDGMPFMDKGSLEQKLNANDSSVRFVPFGYQVGQMTSSQLAKNAYVVALAGEEGAEKLANIADIIKQKNRQDPVLSGFGSVVERLIRVSTLGTGGTGNRLVVNGASFGIGVGGYAFGILEPQNSRAEK